MNSDITTFVLDIKSRAELVGLSIARLCNEAEVSESTFQRWKTKKTKPNLETYTKIVRVLEKYESKNSPNTS